MKIKRSEGRIGSDTEKQNANGSTLFDRRKKERRTR